MTLESNNHSVFLMKYQLVLTVKYRRKVINESVAKRLHEMFLYISPTYNITLNEWHAAEDHIHVAFNAEPNSEISKFINAFKSSSSRMVKKENPEIIDLLFEGTFWAQTFCLLTEGEIPPGVFNEYLNTQYERKITRRKRRY